MSYTAFIGIDPGLTGGIAIITNVGASAIITPLSGKEIDIGYLREWLEGNIDLRVPIAVIESVHSMPGQGVASSFKFGFVTGEMSGMIKAMNIPLVWVSPQTWKKIILAGTDKSKEAAIAFCRNMYPDTSLLATKASHTFHHGLADALCLAHYAQKEYQTK